MFFVLFVFQLLHSLPPPLKKKVICRIRPPTAEEKAADVPIALEALGDGEVGVKTLRSGGWRSFTLDKALGPSTSQEEVFQEVR